MSYRTNVEGLNLSFFEEAGILGAATDMVPLFVSSNSVFPVFDDEYTSGSAATITNNMLQWGSAGSVSWVGYDFTAKSKVLLISSMQMSTATFQYYGISDAPADASNAYEGDNLYMVIVGESDCKIYEYSSPSFTVLSSETSLTTLTADAGNPVFNVALYATSGTQRLFVKSGVGNWCEVLAGTDATHSSFESAFVYTYAKSTRLLGPQFQIWGA